jgi:hypothetical protein
MKKTLGTLIAKITREDFGVDGSPHLVLSAGVSTGALLAY